MTKLITRWLGVAAVCLMTLAASAPAAAQQQPPAPQSEYVPVDSLPPQEQVPALPLLVAAYSVVLVALFVYVLSVARRLQVVQAEMARLEGDMKKSGRG